MKNFAYAVSVLMGTIVGAGIFGIPYVVAQSGFLIGVVFLVGLTGIILIVHLLYGEVVCRSRKKHRLVGYANHYFGKKGKTITSIALIIEFYGALLAYTVIGGKFMHTVLFPQFKGSVFLYTIIFFSLGAFAILIGLKLIERLELIMAGFLILIIFLIVFSGVPYFNIENLKGLNINKAFLPYGVILWALAGGAAIPELKEIIKSKGGRYKKSIIVGTIVPAIIYLVFMAIVVGITGANTSTDAIAGLASVLGDRIITLGAVFGIFAVLTSFFMLGLVFKNIFQYDFGIKKTPSWFLVCVIPLLGLLLGLTEFIPIISFIGVVLGAVEGTMIILIFKRAKTMGDRKPEYSLDIPNIILYTLIGVFMIGLIYQIIYFIK